jgi:hypothetical protein
MRRVKSFITLLTASSKRLAWSALFLGSVGTFAVLPAVAAHAASGEQWCTQGSLCLNGWNGGPEVNVESKNAGNNDFILLTNGNYVNITFAAGDGQYKLDCVGDFGNLSTDARAGLVGGCGGSGVGWGGNFTPISCSNSYGTGYEFKNAHWTNGYLAPSNSANGSAFYLNTGTPYCYIESSIQ